MLAVLAAVGMLLVLSARWPVLVPIQRRLGASGPQPSSADTRWRVQWLRGHLIGTAAVIAFFVPACGNITIHCFCSADIMLIEIVK